MVATTPAATSTWRWSTEGSGGSGRQPGSTFKPIVLAEFIKQGCNLDSTFDGPRIIVPEANIDGGNVDNCSYVSAGQGDGAEATKKSINTIYAQMMMEQVTPRRWSGRQPGPGRLQPRPVAGAGHQRVCRGAAFLAGCRRHLHRTVPGVAHRWRRRNRTVGCEREGNVTRRSVMWTPAIGLNPVSSTPQREVAQGSSVKTQRSPTSCRANRYDPRTTATHGLPGSPATSPTSTWMSYPEGRRRMTSVDEERPVTGSTCPPGSGTT